MGYNDIHSTAARRYETVYVARTGTVPLCRVARGSIQRMCCAAHRTQHCRISRYQHRCTGTTPMVVCRRTAVLPPRSGVGGGDDAAVDGGGGGGNRESSQPHRHAHLQCFLVEAVAVMPVHWPCTLNGVACHVRENRAQLAAGTTGNLILHRVESNHAAQLSLYCTPSSHPPACSAYGCTTVVGAWSIPFLIYSTPDALSMDMLRNAHAYGSYAAL